MNDQVTVLTRERMKAKRTLERYARRRAKRKAEGRKGRRNGPDMLREIIGHDGTSYGFRP